MIVGPPKIKSATVSIVFPSICHEVMGPDAMVLVFWTLTFKPTFSLSSFPFIKRLFSYLLFAIRVMSSAYLRLLIFLPAILIPACASSNPAFHMMYSAYKVNKQGDNMQPWHTFPNLEPVYCSMPRSNCCFPTCIQISQEAGQGGLVVPSLSEFSTVCCDPHSQRLGILSRAEIDIFLELSCFCNDPLDVGSLISGSSAFSKAYLSSLWVHILWVWAVYNDIYPSFYYHTEYFLLCSVLNLSIHLPITTPGNLWSFYHLQNFAFLYHTS